MRTGNWELNDLHAAIFAVSPFLLFVGAMQLVWWPGCTRICAGYRRLWRDLFGFHDVIVHKRLPTRYLPRSAYRKQIVQAHRLHHVVETCDGNASFGFLVALSPESEKAQLKRLIAPGCAPAPRADQMLSDQ